MKSGIFVALALILLSGCSIFGDDHSNKSFKSIQPNKMEVFMQGELNTGFMFEVKDDSGNTQQITDSLRFTWSLDSLWLNSYSDSKKAILDSLENEYSKNPHLVLSQEQIMFSYSIHLDTTTIIGDSTFTFISKNEDDETEDTTRAVVTSQEMEKIYEKAKFTDFEKDTVLINNFDLDRDLQKDSYNSFKGVVQFAHLKWLPDSTFKPKVPFFRLEGNTVIFGAFERSDHSSTYNLMQNAVLEQYRLFVEQL